jgi:small subunit ribosomal protein S5
MPKPAHKKDRFVKREPKEFDEEVVQIDRVTRVVKGGRKLRFRATVVIGDRKGRVGVGIGKSHEVTGAIQKGIAKAKKNLIKVKLDGTTIPHEVKIKYKAAKILIMPAGEGTGIIAGGTIRKVLELAGVKDVLSKSFGTTNKVNTTKGAYEALKLMRTTPRMTKKAEAAKKPEINKPTEPETKPEAKKTETPKPETPKKKPAPKKKTTTKKTEPKK